MQDTDKDFLELLRKQFYKGLWGRSKILSEDNEIADDMVQTLFVKIIPHIGKLRAFNQKQLNGYLFKTLENINHDRYRDTIKSQNLVDKIQLDIEQGIQSKENDYSAIIDRMLIEQLRACLSQKERDIIFFAYDLGMKRKDIAKQMNLSENNIYFTIHHALKKMRKEFLKMEDGGFFEKR